MRECDSFENEQLLLEISQALSFALSIDDTLLYSIVFGRFHRFGQHRYLRRL